MKCIDTKRNKFFKLFLPALVVIQFIAFKANAQFTNTPEGRLALLCKTWGMLKYHHTEVKVNHLNWDSVLLSHVMDVKNAATSASFNSAMNNLVDAAGLMQPAANPSIPNMPINVDFNWITDPMIDSTLHAKLQYTRDNFIPDSNYYVTYNGASLSFPLDNNPSPNDTFPPPEERLLYMFKFWNIINYYSPYKHDMDIPWDQTLVDLIPAFDTASTALSYHLAFCLLGKRISDTHAAYVKSDILYNHWKFTQPTPPVFLRLLNNQTIVVRIFNNIPGLHVGDIIHKINGMDIDSLRMEYRKYFSSSNDATGNLNSLMDMMQTYGNPSIQLETEDSTGATNNVTVNSTMTLAAFSDSIFSCSWCGPAYQLTNCGYGYVNMGKLQSWQVTAMYNALKNAPAIIFDLRNYPNGTAWSIANKMFTANAIFSRLHMAIPEFPGDYNVYMDNIGSANASGYTGKIYILVNEITQSQAEYSAMMLSAMPGASSVKIIGSTTSGGDGDLAMLYLPGNIRLAFSGTGVYYPDSTITQRVGIIPDSVIIPTPAGLRNNMDEVLMAAFDCLTGMEQHHSEAMHFDVFPNPGNGIFNVQFSSETRNLVTISVFNVNGQKVNEIIPDNTSVELQATLNLQSVPNGIYMIEAISGNYNFSKKIIVQHN